MQFRRFQTMTLIIFAIYLFVLIIIFGFIGVVIMHIGGFREYSRSLSIVLRVYIITVIAIAIFGGYQILTQTTPAQSSSDTTKKIEF